MKVVLATHHFPPTYLGGVEMIVRRVSHWLARHRHQVQVVCVESIDRPPIGGVEATTGEYEGITVHRLSFGPGQTGDPFRESFRNPLIGQWFARFLRANRPDIVHIHSGYLLSASVIEAAKSAGLPAVVSLHDYWFFCPRITLWRPNGRRCEGPQDPAVCTWCLRTERRRYRFPEQVSRGVLGRWARRMLSGSPMGQWVGWQEQVAALADRKDYLREMLASADGIITQAPLVYEILLREGIPPERMHLVPYGLDLSGWKALKPARAEDGCLRIGYLGSLTPAKGAHKLISAFRRLCDPHGIRLQLRLHGSMTVLPQYTQALRKLAHGDPRIVFAGRYENSDVESILDEVDVLVVPSLWYEIGPLVTLEALASRTPVVVGNIPNMKYQIRDGVDGLHYEVDRVAELTRQLQRFLDEPGLVLQLRSGIEDVKTSDQEFSEWSEIYQHVLTQVR